MIDDEKLKYLVMSIFDYILETHIIQTVNVLGMSIKVL